MAKNKLTIRYAHETTGEVCMTKEMSDISGTAEAYSAAAAWLRKQKAELVSEGLSDRISVINMHLGRTMLDIGPLIKMMNAKEK